MKRLEYRGLPVIRPSKDLIKLFPCCSTCQAPVIWVETFDKKADARCSNPICKSHRQRLEWEWERYEAEQKQIKLEQERREVRLFFLCLSPVLIPVWLLGGVVAIFYGLGLWGYNSLRLFDEIWNVDDEDLIL